MKLVLKQDLNLKKNLYLGNKTWQLTLMQKQLESVG